MDDGPEVRAVGDFEPREVRGSCEADSLRVDLEHGHHRWSLDEPAAAGGSDQGPTPVEAFLGGLLACMVLTYRILGPYQKVAIHRIEGRVRATPQRHVKEIALELEVWSPAPAEEIEAMLPRVKRNCYVSAVLKPEIAFRVDVRVRPSQQVEGEQQP